MPDNFESDSKARTRRGSISVFPNDDPIGRSLMEYGEWAGLELDFLGQLLSPGDTVVDVGANIGSHTLDFAHRVGRTGRVVAIEPHPLVFALLCRNANEAGLENVTLYKAAAGAQDGIAFIESAVARSEDNFGAFKVSQAGANQVPVVSIDQLSLTACKLIKIDAEGMGAAVIAGASRTLKQHQPIVYVECNDVSEAADIWKTKELRDYHLYIVRCPAFNYNNFLSNPYNTFGHASETAVLAIPARSTAQPPVVEGVTVARVSDLDTLAAAVLSSPRFGDETPFDRVATRTELTLISEELERTKLREQNLRRELEMLVTPQPFNVTDPVLARLRNSKLWPWLKPLRVITRRFLEKGF